ncbi:hypothetical protein EVAR_31584_1 [Eumeta japonica]|uniref:Uncharacterized protein n=1 Tax=Eumeta variegata TaxID=151549 RepID=A0A4C1V9Y7_EUMVA|nr:hypothetical protein EVAR_31584_1 [Eumeta japonica]
MRLFNAKLVPAPAECAPSAGPAARTTIHGLTLRSVAVMLGTRLRRDLYENNADDSILPIGVYGHGSSYR